MQCKYIGNIILRDYGVMKVSYWHFGLTINFPIFNSYEIFPYLTNCYEKVTSL